MRMPPEMFDELLCIESPCASRNNTPHTLDRRRRPYMDEDGRLKVVEDGGRMAGERCIVGRSKNVDWAVHDR